MESLAIPAVLSALAVSAILVLGWRDGWLRIRRRRGHRTLMPRFTTTRHNHAAIAEVAGFRLLRRRIGFQAADAIMQTLAERIDCDGTVELRRTGRTAIEFLFTAHSEADALARLTTLRQRLEKTVEVAGLRFDLHVAIGCNGPAANLSEPELFELADLAVEEASHCAGRIAFAQLHTVAASVNRSANMLANLAHAIRHDQLELHYMPKLNLDSQQVIGAEALCRWTHPDHGEVAPAAFIALAEETGLIDELTLWTLDRAIADQLFLAEQGLPISLEVNLSGRLVSDTRFCTVVADRIVSAGAHIGLEITETATIEAPDLALANLQLLAAAGIRIAIDDFGSGLSSLSYLRNLPAHELKIDQCFIRNLTSSNRDPLLVRSAIEIARALEMEVTAEGVEDELALSLLAVMRCNHVQGFHISPPLPLDDLLAFLRLPDGRERAAGTLAATAFGPRTVVG